jgi:hypothetical protein
MTNLDVKLNLELNGVELYFDNKPTQDTINYLKANKFRWHRMKKCWYAKNNKDSQQIIKDVRGNNIPVSETKETKKTIAKLDTTIIDDPENAYLGGQGWYGINSKKGYTLKDVNRICKQEAKKEGIEIRARKTHYHSTFVTIYIDKDEIVTLEEFQKNFYRYIRNHYSIKVNGVDTRTDVLSNEEINELARNMDVAKENYEIAKKNIPSSSNWIDENSMLNEKGKAKFQRVVDMFTSFNFDYSNGMVDYFHRGFYDDYELILKGSK